MKHFVAYHNREWMKHRYAPPAKGKIDTFVTAKRFRKETLVENRLGVFEGAGSPKHYRLMSFGIIKNLEPGKRLAPNADFRKRLENGARILFVAEANDRPIEVTNLPWFRRLLKQTLKFSNGLSRIKDGRVIAALERLCAHGPGGGTKKPPEPSNTPPKPVLRTIMEHRQLQPFRRQLCLWPLAWEGILSRLAIPVECRRRPPR
ncbi:MAG: hypothetical protein ACREQI_02990 [Candidatus Binataceae bacterium]